MSKPEWIARYNEMAQLYNQESDRGAAVLAASHLEQYLGERLRALLVDDASVDELFKGYGPLSTFAARTDMAFALGLMTRDMKSDVSLIRKIRNHFAHHPEFASFNNPPAKDWCDRIAQGIRDKKGVIQLDGSRMTYIIAIARVIHYLEQIGRGQQRRVIP